MRIIKNLWTMAACCVFFLTACQQDEFRSATSGHVPVRFAPERATAGLTRVTGDNWDNKDKIGIIMIPATSSNSTYGETRTEENVFTKYAPDAYNIPYVIAVDGTNITLTADETKPIYYPVSGESVGFVAYYPYDKKVTVNNSVYKVNVQNQSDPGAIDLLYAKTTDGYNKENPDPVTLDFKHQLSRLNLTVKAAEGITMKLTNVTLTGFPTTANFDLKTGKLTNPAGIADIVPLNQTDGSSVDNFTLILIPHDNNNQIYNRKINFTIAGMVYTYEFEKSFNLTAGSSRTCTLTFTGTKLSLTENESIELDYQKGQKKEISFTSSAELGIKLSSEKNEIKNDIGWFNCTLKPTTDDITNWYTYKLTATSNSFNITEYDNSPRVGYIHLMEGNVSRRVIEVTQKSEQLFVKLNKQSVTVPADGSTNNTFTITTNSQDGEIQVTPTNGNMITNVQKSADAMNNTGVTIWTISFGVPNFESYLGRNASIDATIDNQNQTVAVNQLPIPGITEQKKTSVPDSMTNCYVVSAGESVTFSVLRAYSDATKSILRVDGSVYDGEFVLEKVWDEGNVVDYNANTVKFKGAHTGITIKTKNEGNAVVALIRPDKNEIVWSYHIWVGEYKNVKGWMDRNLGGANGANGLPTKPGTVYQWGRKDPFPGAFNIEDGNAIPYWLLTTTSDGSPATSIKMPDKFITASTWSGSAGRASWNTWQHKTIYDPCPHGYNIHWTNMTELNRFLMQKPTSWNPHPYWTHNPLGTVWPWVCQRNHETGALEKRDKEECDYWTQSYMMLTPPRRAPESTRAIDNGYEFAPEANRIIDPTVYAEQVDARTGLPVRCIAE